MGNVKDVKKLARLWCKDMDVGTANTLIDHMVLGEFDWRDWVDEPMPKGFWSAVFTECQYLTETQE